MLVKLTVSVDKTVVDKIRRISKQHKTSISAIISNYIKTLPDSVSPVQEIPPITKKILEMGAKLPSVPKDWNYRDELIAAMQERYDVK
jgi:hypothetical protein